MKRQSCQKTDIIMTGLEDEAPNLSKNRYYFDRFEGKSAKAVKKVMLF
jgi:hypothetical protein